MSARAFTLIELLIVVAIIAILAAIAVPNFLEAQTRSKVSRAQADMRSFATALEAYALDNNVYPVYGRISSAGIPEIPATVNDFNDQMAFVSPRISTPIAYLTTRLPDVFATDFAGLSELRLIEYLNMRQHVGNFPSPGPPFAAQLLPAWGEWRLVSAGPDRDRGTDIKLNIAYDPTNGTVSDGDIVRSQRFADNAINPDAP